MTAGAVVVGAGNLGFNILVARVGGPSQYGAISALLALAAIGAFMATGTQYAVARQVARGDATVEEATRHGLLTVLRWSPLLLLLVGLSPVFARYLRLSSPVGVALLAGLVLAMVVQAVPVGALLGDGRFATLTLANIGSVVIRIVSVIALVAALRAVNGAMAASTVAVLLTTVPLAWLALTAGSGHRADGPARAPTGDATTGALLAAMVWASWSLPVLLARHAMPAAASGRFGAAQLLASSMLYLTAPTAMALFPGAARKASRGAFGAGLTATAALAILGGLVLVVLGRQVIERSYGAGFVVDQRQLAVFAVSATTTAMLTYVVWMTRARAQERPYWLTGLAAGLVVELALGLLAGADPVGLAAVPVAGAAAAGAVAFTMLGRRRRLPAGRSEAVSLGG